MDVVTGGKFVGRLAAVAHDDTYPHPTTRIHIHTHNRHINLDS